MLITVRRLIDNDEGMSGGEKTVCFIGLIISVCIILTIFNYREFLFVSLGLSAILVILWIISIAVYKKSVSFCVLKKKSFWMYAVGIIVVVTLIAFIYASFMEANNKPEMINGLNFERQQFFTLSSCFGRREI